MSQHVGAHGSSCIDLFFFFYMEHRNPWPMKCFLAFNGINKTCISRRLTWPVFMVNVIEGISIEF